MNAFAGFRSVFDTPAGGDAVLRIAASTLYRAYVNGRFVASGPARGPHGFYRVDELKIALARGRNIVAIEAAGYNINSFWTLNQPSFLQAEVCAGSAVLASTAGRGAPFIAALLPQRVQKVQRYSYQRAFSEVYRFTADSMRWRWDPAAPFPAVTTSTFPAKQLIPRRAPYPDYALRQPVRRVAYGEMRPKVSPRLWRDRSLTKIGPQLLGFTEDQLEATPAVDVQKLEVAGTTPVAAPYQWTEPLPLSQNRFHLLDFGTDLSGFVGARVKVTRPAKLYFTFDEILTKGVLNFLRPAAVNLVAYELQPGVYDLESFEPYTLRFLQVMATEGECEVERVYLREFVNPEVWRAHFSSSDSGLNRLFTAGRETFRQNAVDAFTDCPHRERAGWLCDSYFTARVEPLLTGGSPVEHTFLENYLLPTRFEHLPDGMIPMCYPSDHYNGQFIPNWSLWFILELEEYAGRTGDRAMLDGLRPRVMKLLDFFSKLRNEDGLLEKLPNWVFVEWSAANKFVQDVNYPSNMLYAAALASAGRMYGVPELIAQAEKIRQTVRAQSFDGDFFVDNAVRENGKLRVTRNRSETCQYYAFYLGTATPETHAKLWTVLRDKFGPARKKQGLYPEIHEANAFIGNVLRLELLSRAGLTRQIVDESRAYQLYMADRTGTLWEHQDEQGSLNHGFASHVVNVLYRDVLGLHRVDAPGMAVEVRFTDSPLEWCEGSVPVPGGVVSLRWSREGQTLAYKLDVPAGYRVSIDNRGPFTLKQLPPAQEEQ